MMDGLSHARREWLPAYLISFQAVTTVLLSLRLLSRIQWKGGGLGLDDLFITLGWAVGTASTGISIYAAIYMGFDRHIWDVTIDQAVGATKYGMIISMIYLWSTSLTKISILLFYRRLVAGTYSKRYKWSIWIALATTVIYTSVIFGLTMVTCHPLEALWMRFVSTWLETHHYSCASERAIVATSNAAGILSVVTDFYTVLLPSVLFLKIQMPRSDRIIMMSVFSVGYFVVVAGIVRTVYLVKAEGPDIDKTWNSFNAIIAGKTEGDLGIICACAPSLRSCFKYHFGDRSKMGGAQNNSSDQESNSRPAEMAGGIVASPARKPKQSLKISWMAPLKSPAVTEEFIMNERVGIGSSGQTGVSGLTAHSTNDHDAAALWKPKPLIPSRYGHSDRSRSNDFRNFDFTLRSSTSVTTTISNWEQACESRSERHHIVTAMKPAVPRPWTEEYGSSEQVQSYPMVHNHTPAPSWITMTGPHSPGEEKDRNRRRFTPHFQ